MVDINCDMGEGMPNDAELMPYISSANIACGYHAGDKSTMQHTVGLCIQHKVAIGAHPSFDDRPNFGRTEIDITPEKSAALVIAQIALMKEVCEAQSALLHHVKLHGALYNMAARRQEFAATIAKAIYDFDPMLVLYGLSGSYLIKEGEKAGLKTASEVFADRTYQANGMLTPRSQPGSLIETPAAAVQQVMQMLQLKNVTTIENVDIAIKAETICIHGDGANAIDIAALLFKSLTNNGYTISAA